MSGEGPDAPTGNGPSGYGAPPGNPPPPGSPPPPGYGAPPGYGPPPGYGAPAGYGPPPGFGAGYPSPMGYPPRTNSSAVAGLVLSLVGFVVCFVGSILGIVFAGKAKKEIRASNGAETGEGMATAAQVLGWVGLGVAILVMFLFVGIGFLGRAVELAVQQHRLVQRRPQRPRVLIRSGRIAQVSSAATMPRAITLRHNVSSAPSKIDSTRASRK